MPHLCESRPDHPGWPTWGVGGEAAGVGAHQCWAFRCQVDRGPRVMGYLSAEWHCCPISPHPPALSQTSLGAFMEKLWPPVVGRQEFQGRGWGPGIPGGGGPQGGQFFLQWARLGVSVVPALGHMAPEVGARPGCLLGHPMQHTVQSDAQEPFLGRRLPWAKAALVLGISRLGIGLGP